MLFVLLYLSIPGIFSEDISDVPRNMLQGTPNTYDVPDLATRLSGRDLSVLRSVST